MSKRFFLFSIKWRLILIMIAIIFFTVGIIIHFSSDIIENDKITYVYDLNSSVVRSISRQIETIFEKQKILIDSFHRGYLVSENSIEYIKNFLRENKNLVTLSVFMKEKTTPESTHLRYSFFNNYHYPPETGNKLAKILKDITSSFSNIDDDTSCLLNHTLSTDLPLFTMVFQSMHDRNKIFSATFHGNALKSIYSQYDVYKIFIIKPDGTIISHSNTSILSPTKNSTKLDIVDVIKNQRTPSGLSEYTSSDNKKMLGAYSMIPEWDIAAVLEVPRDIALLSARDLFKNLFFVVAVILIVAIIITILFSRTLSGPIIKLSAATRDIAGGNFQTKIKIKSKDEIGQLAIDFSTMAEKLDGLTKQLVESTKMASIGSMARSIGHEFGNILAGIMGHAELATMSEDSSEAKEHMQIIIDAVERANLITQNLKSFSKKEEKKMSAGSISEVLESVVEIAKPEFNKCGHKINIDATEDIQILMNSQEIGQVFLNLLINASHAMNRDGNMNIDILRENSHAVIKFKDDGCGIENGNLDKIFDHLYTTKGKKGTGLGLSVSKDIIKKHGGNITAESRPGEGTTFIIKIPCA